MMNERRYPVGIQTFSRIREENYIYVDKTDLMWRMIQLSPYIFLSRPRRFGKSLLSTTLCSFFEGRKDLFKGLKVMELEREWQSYPVIHLDLSMAKNMDSPEALRARLMLMLENYAALYGSKESEVTPGGLFQGLIRRAWEQTGRQVVLVIDEYDAPLLEVLHEEENLPKFRKVMQEFYQPLKSSEAMVRFCFITGITKFSQLSIFSTINNLKNISLLPQFSAICGITEQEVKTVFEPDIQAFADAQGVTWDEMFQKIKARYDGYHFSRNSEDVYAPFSLLNALDGGNTDYYWFESGTTTSLIEHLQHYPIKTALEYDGVEVGINEFNVSCENASTPMPLLYQSGYLTIDSYDPLLKTFTLHFPNLEVREGMVSGLMPLILKRSTADGNSLTRNMASSLFKGNLPGALTALRSYIAKIPYDIIPKEEWDDKESRESFYKLLMYMAFSMLNSIVDTEVKSVLGRADVVVKTKSDIYVLELKVDDSVDNALAQIDSKGYAIPYESDGRKVTKCGVSISSEARNIVHWRVVDEEGNVIDEQRF